MLQDTNILWTEWLPYLYATKTWLSGLPTFTISLWESQLWGISHYLTARQLNSATSHDLTVWSRMYKVNILIWLLTVHVFWYCDGYHGGGLFIIPPADWDTDCRLKGVQHWEGSQTLQPPKKKAIAGVATYKTKFNNVWKKKFPCISSVFGNPYCFWCNVCCVNILRDHQGKGYVRAHCRTAGNQKKAVAFDK